MSDYEAPLAQPEGWAIQEATDQLTSEVDEPNERDVLARAWEIQTGAGGTRCSRCGRLAPDPESDEFVAWEALPPDGANIICEGCVTLDEEDTIYEGTLETAREAHRLHVEGQG
jgi:hypothetical protein